jgi:RHS repeat-associated protein
LVVDADHSISYGLVGAAAVAPVISGSTATYREVLPGVDLELTATGEGDKESLVLHSAAAASSFLFPLRLRGLTPRLEDGSVALRDSTGALRALIPAGHMEDARFDTHTGGFAQSSDVTYELTTVDGQPALRVTAGRAWLDDPARVYPVTIDPTTYMGNTGDTYVVNTSTADQSGDNELLVGTWNGGGEKAYSFMTFDGFNNNYNGAKMNGVWLHIFDSWAWTCTPKPFWVNAITQPWVVNSSKTYPGPSFDGNALGSVTANPGVACTNTSGDRTVGTWMSVPLSTGLFQSWALNGTNYGLAVTASQTDSTQWKRFTSRNSSAGMALAPYLEVAYTPNVAPQVDAQYPPSGYAASTLTPELLVAGHDPDAWPNPVQYDFVVYDKDGNKAAESGWTAAANWRVPAGKLSWGQTYQWTVLASDGFLASSSQTLNALGTPVPQPVVTSGLAQNGGQGFEPNLGNYTTSATDAAITTVGPSLTLLRSYNSLDTRRGSALGAGWSSLIDITATEVSTSGADVVVVRYPSGQEVAFGKNPDGTYAPPPGRFASFSAVPSGGYKLVDKDGTVYLFTAPASGPGVWSVSSISDAAGRTETFTYNSPAAPAVVTTITSASGRALHLTWSTPAGASAPHVATVFTDPVSGSDQSTALTWQYTYSGDLLTKVCPPTSWTTDCTSYTYANGSLASTTVLNAGPRSYWRLGEQSGTTAASAVLGNEGTDNGTYTNVTLGQPGRQAASTATAAGFDGTASRVDLPSKLPAAASYQSTSLWFKTSTGGGVLLGQSTNPITTASTTAGYTPVLYVGTDGKLAGQFPTVATPGLVGGLQGVDSGRCLDVAGVSNANGAQVQLYDCWGGANQLWTLTSGGALQVTISGVTKCLDVSGYGTANGTKIQLWDCTGATNQQWTINADGRIVGTQSGKCLDASGYGTTNGTPIWLYDCFLPVHGNQTFFSSTHAPIVSTNPVTDGQWHHAVLTAAGSTQSLYLDGQFVGSKSAVVQDFGTKSQYIGTGFLGGGWPAQPNYTTWSNTGVPRYFAGSISDVAVFDQPLNGSTISSMYRAGSQSANLLTSVVRPSNNSSATIAYNGDNATLTQVTDANGGVWQVGAPTVSGSSQVYVGSVLAPGPTDYYRLAESGTTQAVNQVNGNTATYNAVTQGLTGGPFEDATVAGFNGSSSYLKLPASDVPTNGPASIGMWFKMPAGNTAGGVLFDYQNVTLDADNNPSGNWTPALYVGTDGKLRGHFWINDMSKIAVSANPVNDGQWHYVVLAASTNSQSLYLDGARVGNPVNAPLVVTNAQNAYIGAGKWYTWPGSSGVFGYFPGQLAEVAYYRSQLTDAQVAQQFAARAKATGVPAKTVVVTDPGGKTITHVYDVATGRQVAETDALGNKTQYGYDVAGFLRTVTDPNGNVTTTEHDVRGNTVSQTTCQNQAANRCSTVYYTYYPDAFTKVLTPDPRNDVLLTVRDARSSSGTDNTYLTTYTYDNYGNRTAVTTPPVPGSPSGRTTTSTFTAAGGGVPPGLPSTLTTPGGARQTVTYLPSGDVATVTDPAGKVTSFTYDGIGRVLTKTETTDRFPAGLTVRFTYDKLSRVVSQTTPPVTDRVTGAVHTAVTTTVYNVDGLATSQTVTDTTGGDASRSSTMSYNQFGQAVSVTDAAGKTTQFEYDAYGNPVKETGADGAVTTTTYDAEGRLLTSTFKGYTGDPNNPGPPTDLVVTSKAYDPAGRLASATDAMGWVTSYTYTDNGLTARVTRKDPSTGATFVQEDNGYDAAGNLVSRTTNNGATTATYTVDAAARTTSSTVDPSGLKRTTSLTLSADDYVLSTLMSDATGATVGRNDAAYDPMGRMTSRTVYNVGSGGPTGWWKLDETSGTTAADSAPSNRPGTLGSGVSWSGGAAAFTGTGAITTAGPVLDTTQSFSVSAWLNLASTAGYETAVSQDGSMASAFCLQYDKADNRWAFCRNNADVNNSTVIRAMSSTAPALGVWTHLVGVYDSTTGAMTLYVNGAQAGTAADTTPFATSGPLVIGRGKWGGATNLDPFNGSIANVQVYNRALSSSEASTLYTAGRGGAALATDRLTTSYALDQSGLPTAVTDPNGNTTNYDVDEAGRVVVVTKPTVLTEVAGGTPVLTRPVSYSGYNTFGELVETKDPNGNVTVTGYDAAGRVVSTQLPSYTPPGSSAPIVPVATRAYDSLGQLTTSTDPLGKTTSYVYDQLGQVAKVTAPNLGVTTYTYDLLGDRLSTTDPTGAVSTATYDYLGRTLTSTAVVRQAATNYTTTYTYGTGGWLSSARSPAGVTTSTTYNAAGEPLTVTDGAGNVTRHSYDGAGRPIKTTLPDNTYSTVTYDLAGRTIAAASYNSAGTRLATQSTAYDANGNATAVTDARGTTTTYGYDATGLLTSEVQPVSGSDSITTTFGYDAGGNRTRFTDGRGNAFVTTYNTWGAPESQIEPATAAHPGPGDRTFTAIYDANGRVASQTLPGGVSLANTYDDVGNLTRQSGAGAEVATTDRTFGYDLAGRVTSASASAGALAVSYDDRGLPLSVTGVAGSSSFTYTPDGGMASRTDAAGATTYGYDTAGRLSTAANPSTGVALSYTYNSLSQVSTIAYGTSGNTRSFSYDGLHRLTGDELKTPSAATIAKIVYGYDANSNETSKTATGFTGAAANTYTYDLADRLTSWTAGTATTVYAYDKSGNRVQAGGRTFTYDQRNRLVSGSDGTTYTYTARGTLSSTTSGSTVLDTRSNAFGQVMSQAASGSTQNYTYDGLGRVIRAGFAYSGVSNTLASDGTASYTRDPGDDLIGVSSGGTATLAWTDQHTDVVGQFTSTGTALSGSTTYDPLGKVLATGGMLGNLGYQSEYTDPATNRVNMLARWYNTDTGQFDTRDPVGNNPVPDSINANRYAYASANPLTVTDPTGNWSLWGAVKSVASKTVSTVTSVASSAYSYASSYASSAWNYASSYASSAWNYASSAASSAWNSVTSAASSAWNSVKSAASNTWHAAKNAYHSAKNWVNHKIDQGRKWVAQKYHQAKQAVKHVYNKVKQAGKALVATTVRVATKAVNHIKDAYNATEKWVKDHKNLLIEVAAIAGGVLAGLACTAVTAGAGAVACMVGAAALINLAKDAAQGNIHNWGDAFGSLGTGAVQGLFGAAGGVIGGKVAGFVVGKLGSMAANIGGRMLAGGIAGGVGDAFAQFATTGHVNWGGVAMSAGIGAAFGGFYKGGAGAKGGGGGNGGGGAPAARGGGDLPTREWRLGERPEQDIGYQPSIPKSVGVKPGQSLAEGDYHYVVRTDGSLRAAHNDVLDTYGEYPGHASLADHGPVHMAGTFHVNEAGQIDVFGNFSGHYKPYNTPGYKPLEDVALAAFAKHGFTPLKDSWDYYDPFKKR